jgi:hypothetical protein
MSEWILILVLWGGNAIPAVTSVPFNTQADCVAAKETAEAEFRSDKRGPWSRAICVQRNGK